MHAHMKFVAQFLLARLAWGLVGNMNGEYLLSETPKGNTSKFPTQYRDYPRGAEFFDVTGPVVSTLYSQVYWAGQDVRRGAAYTPKVWLRERERERERDSGF